MLKKITIGLILGTLSLFSGDLKINSYSDMRKDVASGTVNKPILFFVGSSKCGYCTQELSDIKNNPKIVQLINDKFYFAHADQDLEELTMDLTVNLTPSMHILNPGNLKIMTPDSIEGAVPMDQLEIYLKKIDSAYQQYLKIK